MNRFMAYFTRLSNGNRILFSVGAMWGLAILIAIPIAIFSPTTQKPEMDPTVPIESNIPSLSPSLSPSITETFTLIPTDTFTYTPSITQTFTLIPTNTFTITPSMTATNESTPTSTCTATVVPTNTLAVIMPTFTVAPLPTRLQPTAPIVQPTSPPPPISPPAAGCCKHCGSTSQPCGDACISNKNTCHTAPGCACR
jgi:hypothetical protein